MKRIIALFALAAASFGVVGGQSVSAADQYGCTKYNMYNTSGMQVGGKVYCTNIPAGFTVSVKVTCRKAYVSFDSAVLYGPARGNNAWSTVVCPSHLPRGTNVSYRLN